MGVNEPEFCIKDEILDQLSHFSVQLLKNVFGL